MYTSIVHFFIGFDDRASSSYKEKSFRRQKLSAKTKDEKCAAVHYSEINNLLLVS
jgi:hypothetical protein